ncbi:MAG TPA: hypothetical protein VFS20_23225 [Longimicrobium sp.]|nr:hypothetical protein [Longimicrobium sp.]
MKLTIVRIAAALVVIAAAPAAARAQAETAAIPADSPPTSSTRPLAVGDELRLTAADQQFTGTLKRITADSLELVAPYRLYRLPRRTVTAGERAEFAESRGRAIFRGVRMGVLGGAVLGLLGSALMTKDLEGRAFIIADGVALGALVGSALGARSRRSQWERVDPVLLQPAELPAPAAAPGETQR